MSFALKTIIKRTLTAACLGSVILATTSCSMFKGVEDPTEGWTADKLYVEARDNLNEGNYETARDYYQKLEARYPYGRYSQQAQVETAYSYFKEGEPQQAIAVCDRFLRQYPEHPLSPYALYIKGIATLDEDEGWMSYLTRQDLSKRDAQAARDAFDIFKNWCFVSRTAATPAMPANVCMSWSRLRPSTKSIPPSIITFATPTLPPSIALKTFF